MSVFQSIWTLVGIVNEGLQRLTDEALMLQYASGENRAFDQLMDRYERRVFIFIKRYVSDEHIAAEILQETFIRVIGAADRYRPTAKFSTWILRIARNLCTDHARKNAREKAVSVASNKEENHPISRTPSKEESPDRILMNREIRVEIETALQDLPQKQREVFEMRQRLDLSFREIATIVDASENTVKSRMRYALESLRIALSGFYQNGAK